MGVREQLTRREQEVLHRLMQGYSRHEIARDLHLPYSTVVNRGIRVYRKLDVRNEIELMRLYHKTLVAALYILGECMCD